MNKLVSVIPEVPEAVGDLANLRSILQVTFNDCLCPVCVCRFQTCANSFLRFAKVYARNGRVRLNLNLTSSFDTFFVKLGGGVGEVLA